MSQKFIDDARKWASKKEPAPLCICKWCKEEFRQMEAGRDYALCLDCRNKIAEGHPKGQMDSYQYMRMGVGYRLLAGFGLLTENTGDGWDDN